MPLNEKYVLIRDKILGQDPRVDDIINATDPVLVELYAKAKVLNVSQLKKSYVEASLLCEPDLVKISHVIDVLVDVLSIYQEFFFDTRNFDKLSKIEHIESIEDVNEKTLKLWALGQGLDFINWRLGNKVDLSPIKGLTEAYSMCLYKSREAVYSNNTSDSSKEAIKWTKLSVDVARLLKMWVLDSGAARSELELAIKEVVPEFMGLDQLLEENK